MRFLAAAIAFLIMGSAHASQIGCETTIVMGVSEHLETQKSKEVVNGDPTAAKFLSTTALYTVSSAAEYGTSRTKWAVLVKTGPQNTCEILDIVEDEKVVK